MSDPRTFRGLQVCGFGHPRSALRRHLTDLVLTGTKTATAGLLAEYQMDDWALPQPGVREVVIDAHDRFVAEIETTECRVLRMADVDDEFARDEGEGFADAADWRAAHERFWNGYIDEIRAGMGDPGWSLNDDTPIVCQRFRLAEVYAEPIPSGVSPA
ncbi:MAG TPA: ASCH domain-containing protein [Candidatus Limnocylindria bacterium]|nr:ASCH domain-containing protein [Candidatus Limnocylindria bacterium]